MKRTFRYGCYIIAVRWPTDERPYPCIDADLQRRYTDVNVSLLSIWFTGIEDQTVTCALLRVYRAIHRRNSRLRRRWRRQWLSMYNTVRQMEHNQS